MPIRDKQLVVCTPAGRHQYMRILAPRILSDPQVDRWDIWLNTDYKPDIDYLRKLSQHPKCRLVEIPEPIHHPLAYRIHKFFVHATDPDSVYIRLDDDIVYYHSGSIGELARYRLDNPHPFLVYGNVVNTAKTSYIHQQLGRIPLSRGQCGPRCMDAVGWGDPRFCELLHRDFLSDPSYNRWIFNDVLLDDYDRQSINVISWTGEDCAKWANIIHFDEEAWLAHVYPKESGRPNIIAGHCGPFVHYAFYSQRNGFSDDLLKEYAKLPILPTTIERLNSAIETIKTCDISLLQNVDQLSKLVASVGLYNDGREMYGSWESSKAIVREPGLWQHPEEFSRFLIWSSKQNLNTILEVGCFYGFMSAIFEAYTRRFNPYVNYIAIDTIRYIRDIPSSTITYYFGVNSSNYSGPKPDLVFIDADHNYYAALSDYERFKDSKFVVFHDINDDCVRREAVNGGIPTLYGRLKQTRPHIELLRSDGQKWMGIGVLS